MDKLAAPRLILLEKRVVEKDPVALLAPLKANILYLPPAKFTLTYPLLVVGFNSSVVLLLSKSCKYA